MEKKLTEKAAYLAMFAFLESHYIRTKSDDVGSLLSGMCLMNDGMPMDSAYWREWQESIVKVEQNEVDAEVRFEQ